LPENPQLVMCKTVLTSFIHPDHKLYLLAKEIDWASLEKEFEPLYGTTPENSNAVEPPDYSGGLFVTGTTFGNIGTVLKKYSFT